MQTVQDSLLSEIWSASTVTLYSNVAEVMLPTHYAITRDVIAMLDHTEACWGHAEINAILFDDEPRVLIRIVLVDYWNDEQSAKWKAEHPTWPDDVMKVISWDAPNAQNAGANGEPTS